MKNVTAIDNPLNGFVDEVFAQEYLGMFLFSPMSLNTKNDYPELEDVSSICDGNQFFDIGDVFYDRGT